MGRSIPPHHTYLERQLPPIPPHGVGGRELHTAVAHSSGGGKQQRHTAAAHSSSTQQWWWHTEHTREPERDRQRDKQRNRQSSSKAQQPTRESGHLATCGREGGREGGRENTSGVVQPRTGRAELYPLTVRCLVHRGVVSVHPAALVHLNDELARRACRRSPPVGTARTRHGLSPLCLLQTRTALVACIVPVDPLSARQRRGADPPPPHSRIRTRLAPLNQPR
eukprot:COSAG02_NODE_8969_length_2378_cov_7.781044_1_plen_223_part_00